MMGSDPEDMHQLLEANNEEEVSESLIPSHLNRQDDYADYGVYEDAKQDDDSQGFEIL